MVIPIVMQGVQVLAMVLENLALNPTIRNNYSNVTLYNESIIMLFAIIFSNNLLSETSKALCYHERLSVEITIFTVIHGYTLV